jgi:nicotinate-nucleotide adenylyltransferase
MTVARLGVFGGTFNPIHVGHLRAVEDVAEQLELDRVLFVPAAEPPHKADTRGDPIAPAALRLAWVSAAIDGNPRLEVDPQEIERGGRSFTFRTLERLASRTAPERPVFVIGCDAFALLDTWREIEKLFALAHFAVMTRPPVEESRLADWLPDCLRGELEFEPDGRSGLHRRAGGWIRAVRVCALDVSSSDIRARIRTGRSVRYLLPEPVRHAVLESGVYGNDPADYAGSRP